MERIIINSINSINQSMWKDDVRKFDVENKGHGSLNPSRGKCVEVIGKIALFKIYRLVVNEIFIHSSVCSKRKHS